MRSIRVLACLGLVVIVPPAVAAGDPASMKVDDIRTCMRGNFVERGALRDIEVVSTDRESKSRTLKAKLYWKPTESGDARMNLRVTEPEDLKGSSYLLLEKAPAEEVYVYLPAVGRPTQITGDQMNQPLWGTDFSYSDVKQIQGFLQTGETQRRPDAKVAERSVYVLETALDSKTGGFRKVVSYVDQQSCTLLKSEFFAKGEAPRKRLEADVSTLLSADTYWLVLGYTMRDLAQNTQTRVTMSDFYLGEQLGEKRFKPDTFFTTTRD